MMRMNKKTLITLISAIALCICIIFIFLFYSQDTKDSVICEYDVQNGIVSFRVDSNYELSNIQLNYGYVKLPNYDSNTKTISFSIFDLDEGKNEFFTFYCSKKEGNEITGDRVTYEVIRGHSEVVITRYKQNIQMESQSYYFNN